ncbi:hypothetical protein GH714_036161 [Hevea brasiliensis]|uniref:BRX domain-containing protein n=2 Tax=Hevea brasiliensis TaxID=3981 RepID=A0A6A6LPM1_HEVBR|nr:hypothetical protein GH714_036161 [Hevea brasiliensis]
MASLATSPLPGRISPPRSSFDDSKYMNDSLIDEITSLRAQVEELTYKSRHLDAELERKSRQLKEVAAIAADEAEKRKSAKEVIKTLTAQLKQMAEKLPEKQNSSPISGSITKHASIAQNISSERHSSCELSCEIESNGNAVDHQMLSYTAKAQTEKPPWVVQAEPGVYITLSSLPGGGNELKRIRFSRKHFTEQEAEKWWAENGSSVCERHNILNGKTFKKPRRPYEKERLDAELKLVGEYGLRCKRELWRVQYALSRIRNAARMLLTLDEKNPRRIFEGEALLRRMNRYGLLDESQNKLDYVLALTVENFLERRLQTLVFKSGMAKSIHHARVLIRQRHIRVGRQVVNIPSFMVRVDSQKHIDFSLTSPFGGGRPGRVKRKNQRAANKKSSGGDGDEEDEE